MNQKQLDAVSTLVNFGIDKIDAMMYIGLLQYGTVTIGALSNKLEMDRGKAYRALNRLRNIGMVTTTFSNPTMVSAIEPENALTMIIQKKEDEIATLTKLSRQLVKDLHDFQRPVKTTSQSSFSIIQGRSNIYTRIGKMLEESSNIMYIVTTVEDVLRMYHTSIPEKIKTCTLNGIEVRLLTDMPNENAKQLLNDMNVTEIRTGKLPSKSRMVVEKENYLIMSGSMKETMDLNDDADSVLITNSIEMVENMFSLCNHLWRKSKKIEILA